MMNRHKMRLNVYIVGLLLLFSPAISFATSSDEESAKSYLEEANELNKLRRYDEAIVKLTQAVELSLETHKYHQALVMTYLATRQGPKAILHYKKMAQEHPKSATVRYWLGRLYLESRALEDSVREFQKAARLAPGDEHAFISLGHVYLRMGKEKEALNAYLQANKLTPRVAVVHAGIGNIYFNRKDFDKAEKEFEEALKLDASLTEARYNLSLIYEKKGEFSKAVGQWKTLLEEDPNESRARERLARIYFRGEQYQDAVREYSTLSTVKQNSPEIFFALGEAQIMLAATLTDPDQQVQLKKSAVESFKRTLELDPQNSRARKYLDRLASSKDSAQKK